MSGDLKTVPVRVPELLPPAGRGNCRDIVAGPQIPVITHFNKDLSLDLMALREEVRYLVEHGIVTGKGVLLAAGAGGDFPMLSLDERKKVVETIFEAADGRAPVIAGCQDTNPLATIDLAKFSESLGAYAIQMSPPYYYHPSDDDVLRFFRSIHDATAKIGMMIYNTWWHNYNIEFPVMDKILGLKRVIALKWSHPSGGLEYAQGVKRYKDEIAVIDNAFMCVWTHLLGGHGFITHFATVYPEHELNLWRLCDEGRYAEAMEIHSRDNYAWADFRIRMSARTGGEAPVVKAALELAGRNGGPCRPPARELNAAERADLKNVLMEIGVPGV